MEDLCKRSKLSNTCSGRHKSETTPEKVKAVSDSVDANHTKSIRRRAVELCMGRTSLNIILKHDMKAIPYRIQTHQRLTNAHKDARVEMCRWFLNQIALDGTFVKNVWFSDEANFYLNGYVNSKNYIYWGTKRPDEVVERGLHDQKVTVWAAMSAQGIIGPFFFQENGNTVTVNSERYISVGSKFWRKLETNFTPEERDRQWFQQDGAAPHCSRLAMAWLRDHFENRIVSRRTESPWSPNSPDLNLLDFHLWGYLKDQTMGTTFATKTELMQKITRNIRNITVEQCQRVCANFVKRLNVCISKKGGHLEHVM